MEKKKKLVKNSESKYQQLISIFDNIDELVYVSDPETYEILYINQAIKNLSGEAVGQKCYSAFQKMDGPCPFCTNDRIFGKNEGNAYMWEYKCGVNNRWYRRIDKAIPWPDGRMVRYEIAFDIHDQKEAEEEVKKTHQTLQTMIQTSPLAIVTLDLQWNVTMWNRAAEKLFGWCEEEVLGRFIPIVSEDKGEECRLLRDRAFKGETLVDVEVRRLKKDGSKVDLRISIAPLKDRDGEITGLMSVMADISDRKSAEEELRQSEKKYRTTVENAGTAILVIENDTIISYVNNEFEKMTGYSKQELIGKMSWTAFFRGEELERMKEYHRLRRINRPKAPRYYESTLYDRNGNQKKTYINVDVIPETRRSVASLQDITDLKLTEEALRQAKEHLENQNKELIILDRVKDGIIRDITHELKTPVAKQAMQLEIIRKMLSEKELSESVGKHLGIMESTIKRQQNVIRNVLELSRLESGGRKCCKAPVRLDKVLNKVIEDYRPIIEARKIKISTRLSQSIIQSDEEMLWHVFSNIINNAIKFTNDGQGKIDISIAGDNEKMSVRIFDNGIGLSGEEKARVFDRFYQVVASNEGCGVGLSICKLILFELGGRITIESEGIGKGTTAVVDLPLE